MGKLKAYVHLYHVIINFYPMKSTQMKGKTHMFIVAGDNPLQQQSERGKVVGYRRRWPARISAIRTRIHELTGVLHRFKQNHGV